MKSPLQLSVLDQSRPRGGTATDALHETIALAVATEALGYRRFWVAEHHNGEFCRHQPGDPHRPDRRSHAHDQGGQWG